MEDTFVVSPMKQQISLKAGETYEGSVLVTNPIEAKEDLTYKIVVAPYSVVGKEYKPDFETVSDWSKIVDWIEIENATDTIAPNESKRVNFKIKVPESAPAGGQYAMIGVSSVPKDTSKKSEIRDIYTMGSLIYAKIDGETIHQGEVIDNHVSSFISSGMPTAFVTVTNEGNVHETLKTKIKVKNVFSGEEIALSNNDEKEYETLILPDSTRIVSRNLEGLPGLGIFEVSQDVSYIGKDSGNTTIMVICPIWFIVLVFVTAVTIIGTICYRIFRKRQKSSKKQLQFDNGNDKMDS